MNIVSPIKIQGKKTKLLFKIKENIDKTKKVWVEPFLGSGEVLFNINPEFAYVSDNNEHIINFFLALQKKQITSKTVKEFLEKHGQELENKGAEYYYQMRSEFNDSKESLYFLFLNRSCFNGVMRFNSKGYFNVPFCNKPGRFSKSYITKITNQVEKISSIIISHGSNWIFEECDWKQCFQKFNNNNDAFFYFDPPYVNRHSTYIDQWKDEDNDLLFESISKLKTSFLLSNWYSNKYRKNNQIEKYFSNNKFKIDFFEHFYHVGANVDNRNAITECLITRK